MEVKLFDSFDHAKSILGNKEPRLLKALNWNICIVRNNEELFAFQNECPHQGASLHQGVLNHLDEIVCPLHSYRFHIQTGEAIESSCRALKKIPVVLKQGEIFLELDD